MYIWGIGFLLTVFLASCLFCQGGLVRLAWRGMTDASFSVFLLRHCWKSGVQGIHAWQSRSGSPGRSTDSCRLIIHLMCIMMA